MDQAIVRTNPEQIFLQSRFGQRIDGSVYFRADIVPTDWAARRLLFTFIITREITTDYLPVHAVIIGLQQHVGAAVHYAWIMIGDEYRGGPLKTEPGIPGAVSDIGQRPWVH